MEASALSSMTSKGYCMEHMKVLSQVFGRIIFLQMQSVKGKVVPQQHALDLFSGFDAEVS